MFAIMGTLQDSPMRSSYLKHNKPRLCFIKGLEKLVQLLRWVYMRALKNKYKTLYRPGHFYSPIPSIEELRRNKDYLYVPSQDGIDLNAAHQVALLDTFRKYYAEIPVDGQPAGGSRYNYDNDYFRYADGVILYSFLRHLSPKHIIEVGSGNSTMLMLDVNEKFFDNRIRMTVIDPYPECLLSRLSPGDHKLLEIHEKPVQALGIDLFGELQGGDILFIDSSHVGKSGSDVLHYLFRIFPKLRAGVFIHLHDMFYPFEYPFEWLELGRAWNELYLVRAFLVGNHDYQIEYFNDYMGRQQPALLEAKLPLCRRDTGSSLWLQKLR